MFRCFINKHPRLTGFLSFFVSLQWNGFMSTEPEIRAGRKWNTINQHKLFHNTFSPGESVLTTAAVILNTFNHCTVNSLLVHYTGVQPEVLVLTRTVRGKKDCVDTKNECAFFGLIFRIFAFSHEILIVLSLSK